MSQSIEATVVDVIVRNKDISPDRIVPQAELSALGITSLDVISIVYDLEEALGVEVPNDAIDSLRTVQDLVDGLQRLAGARDE